MDFLFYVPFFYTAAAAVAEILTVYFVNIVFRECKKLILNQVFEFRPNIISCVAKLPDSTRRKEAIFNKGSLFYSHCAIANVFLILSHQ
jgi:hypothetical protein